MTHHVPMPRRLPVIGNLHQIPKGHFAQFLLKTSRRYDGVFRLDLGGKVGMFFYDADLVAELCDETRFRKLLGQALYRVRDFAGDGLFTAFGDEPNWALAHRILMPAFSQRSIRGYFPEMLEVAKQLIAKWDRNHGRDLQVADDMTRLTLDTISLAGFGYRFNSFQTDKLDPFLAAMGDALTEVMHRLTRMPLMKHFPNRAREQAYADDIALMHKLVDDVIAERRAHPTDGNDLLNLMLTNADPETGQKLDDVNIRFQVVTFLIAGHETTSGLLTFALYLLMRHPGVLAQAYAEVDRVIGDREPEHGDIGQLTVIDRCIKETQRLFPTAPAITVGPYEDTEIGRGIRLQKDRPVVILITALHRDPGAWKDPETFDIDRWLPEAEKTHHPHGYKPFGNGTRACIGRQFALAEAKLALAMILQNFALSDPHDYKLAIKETLTIKPDGFTLRARRRQPHERTAVAAPAAPPSAAAGAVVPPAVSVEGAGRELTVLYGTSLGTCREVADQIAARGEASGFAVVEAPLDACVDALPSAGTLVVVTSTYNGRAPDSAARLETAITTGRLRDVRRPDLRYAVLGCGNTQWAATYQFFPKLVDETLRGTGATPLIPRGEADAAGDFDGAVEAWLRALWQGLGEAAPPAEAPRLGVTILRAEAAREAVLPENAVALPVISNTELVRDPTGLWDFALEKPRSPTRQVVLGLPDGMTYRTGDHIAVYARNRPDLVAAMLARLGLQADTVVVLEGARTRHRHLPVGRPLTVGRLLSDFVELQDPLSRADLRALLPRVTDGAVRAELEALCADDDAGRAQFQTTIADKRVTLLDVVTRHDIPLDLDHLLEACGAIRPRFYSISSSPLEGGGQVALTVGTINAPAWSGAGLYEGMASSYMRGLAPGHTVTGFVRRPNPPFAPPDDPAVPMILICAGTGIAPFRGFLAERAAQRRAGTDVAPSLLFYGCRHPAHDLFYADELAAWERDGVVTLRTAFSVAPAPDRFVQDALWSARREVWEMQRDGGIIYVCGDGRFMAPAVRDTLIRIEMAQNASTHEQASDWLEALIESGGYHQDVFGG